MAENLNPAAGKVNKVEGPTPSQMTNDILDYLKKLLEGDIDEETYLQKLDELKGEIEESKVKFMQELQKATPEQMQIYQNEIESLKQAQQEYEKAVDLAYTFVNSIDEETYEQIVYQLQKATYILVNTYQLYMASPYFKGPSENPMVNYLYQSKERYKEGLINEDVYKASINTVEGMISTAKDQLSKSKKEKDQEGLEEFIDAILRAYDYQLEVIPKLLSYVEDEDDEKFDEAMKEYDKATKMLQDATNAYIGEKMFGRPTKFHYVNFMINAIQALLNEEANDELLLKAKDAYDQNLGKLKRDFNLMTSTPIESVMVQEAIEEATDALDMLDLAREDVDRFLEERAIFYLERALENFKSGAEKLYKAYEDFKLIEERENQVLCPKCGHANPKGTKYCQNCGMKLPESFSQQDSSLNFKEGGGSFELEGLSDIPLTDNLKKVLDAVNGIHEGKITVEEYLSTLDWWENVIASADSDVAKIEAKFNTSSLKPEEKELVNDLVKLIDETKQNFQLAVDTILDGIDKLRLYVDDPNEQHLIEGVRTVVEGFKSLYEIQKVAEELQKRVEGKSSEVSETSNTEQEDLPKSEESESAYTITDGFVYNEDEE